MLEKRQAFRATPAAVECNVTRSSGPTAWVGESHCQLPLLWAGGEFVSEKVQPDRNLQESRRD